MRTAGGIITFALTVALAGCGTKKDEGEVEQTGAEKKAASASLVKADKVTSERRRDSNIPPKPTAKADPASPDSGGATQDGTATDEGPASPASGGATQDGTTTLVKKDGLSLASIVLSRGIEKRKPVDPGTSFKAERGVFLYTIVEVLNPEREPASIKVSWRHADADKEIGGIVLKVKDQEKWKTWAKTGGVTKPGKWVAIVRDENGQELGRAPFELTE